MNRLTLVARSFAILLASSTAWAQSVVDPAATTPASDRRFGRQGQVSLGAERLFGVSYTTQSPGTASATTVSLMGSSGLEAGFAPYSIPRLGLDYFASDGFSLGFGMEFANVSQGGNFSPPSLTLLGLNPRLGYAVQVIDGFSFWPRAGFSYVHLSSGSQSSYLLAGSLEVQFVVTPLQHFGFMLGPVLDIGLAGTSDLKLTQVGLQTALLGWF